MNPRRIEQRTWRGRAPTIQCCTRGSTRCSPFTTNIAFTPIPEPATVVLGAVALALLFGIACSCGVGRGRRGRRGPRAANLASRENGALARRRIKRVGLADSAHATRFGPPFGLGGIQSLEPRLPLAASVMNGLFEITGSPFADDIRLAAGPNVGDVAVFGVPGVQDGTLFHDIRAVKVDALAGNDRVRIGPIDLVPPDANQPEPCFDVGGGFGDDAIEILSLARADGRSRMFVIDSGEGNNSTTVRFGDGTKGQVPPIGMSKIRTEYRSGAGRDAFAVEYTGPLEIDFVLAADTGAGADQLDVRLLPVAVEPPPPNPGDNVEVEPPPPSPGDNPNEPPPGVPTFHWSADLRTGAGIDVVNMDVAIPADPCYIAANFGIDLGAGNDFAFVQLNSGADELALALHIAGQEGSDEILARVYPSDPCAFKADIDLAGGEGTDTVGLVMNAANQPQQELPVLDVNVKVSGGTGKDMVAAMIDVRLATGAVDGLVAGDEGKDRLGLFADLPAMLQSTLVVDGGEGIDECVTSPNVQTVNCEA